MNPSLIEVATGILYCVVNRVNGKRYIGKTKHRFFDRYAREWWIKSANWALQEDIDTFGKESFEIEIYATGYDDNDLLQLEAFYISDLDTLYPRGYNLVLDTDPCDPTSGKFIVARRDYGKIYVFQKEPGDRIDAFYRNIGSGKTCSDQTKAKISAANLGKRRTPEQRKRISLSITGKKQSPEAIANRSRSLKGKKSIPVLQLDPITNAVLAEHASITEAAEALGLSSASNLTSVCKGRQLTAGGYKFRYKT